VTRSGTVILTAYEKLLVSLAGVQGRSQLSTGWVWDSLFQEFDLATGSLILQWRASDHFALTSSYIEESTITHEEPWDWFHMNSVEKDGTGNYLVSSRHLRTIFYIEAGTGRVLWKLGGKDNMFTDLSAGDAITFVGQHDAHWDGDDRRYITFFDNRADWMYEIEHVSKAKRVAIDTETMTARLDAVYVHPERISSSSQGSYQSLPNGNVLIGYGYTGALTEFSKGGEVLCDAYLGPSSRFSSGDVQSYRDLKFNWTGIPLTPPDVVMQDGTISVSWLGSTEVRSWRLEHAYEEDGGYRGVLGFAKTGFETKFDLPFDLALRRYVRVVALDKDRSELHATLAMDIGDEALDLAIIGSVDDDEGSTPAMHEDTEIQFASEVEPEYAHIQSEAEDQSEEVSASRFEEEDRELIITLGFLTTLAIMILLTMVNCPCTGRRRLRDGEHDSENGGPSTDGDGKRTAIVQIEDHGAKAMETFQRLWSLETEEKGWYCTFTTR
jgi:hypothetical protein